MSCDMMTKSRTPCSRAAVYSIESFIDEEIVQKLCCTQHKSLAIKKLVSSDASHWGHGERIQDWSGHINTHVTVTGISKRSSGVERIHVGVRQFGPVTELEHLQKEYDEYFDEYSLIGMYNLRDEDDPYYPEWLSKYKMCKRRMAEIDHRMEVLQLYEEVANEDVSKM